VSSTVDGDANIALTLRQSARNDPERAALIFPNGRDPSGKAAWTSLTFRELDSFADRYARGFASVGVARGDRVLILFKPSIEFFSVLYGLLRLGAIPIFVDPSMGLRNVLGCVAQVKPRVVAALPAVHALRVLSRRAFRSAEVLVTAGRRWFWGGHTLEACLSKDTDPWPSEAFSPTDEALIAFTSGSTGPPKGVSFTHGMLNAQTRLIGEQYGWEPGQTTVMCFAPFVLLSVARGNTTVVPDMDLSKPATADPERVVEAIQHHSAERALASPIVWMNVTRHCQSAGLRLPELQQVLTMGAPIQADLHRRFRTLLPEGAQLFTPYGATESLPVANVGTDEILGDTWLKTAEGRGTCVGKPFPGVRVRVMRVTDAPIEKWSDALELAQGEIGELVIDGPIVSPEYKDRPDANAKAKMDCDGRTLHRIDDLGYIDELGRLWFCGRKNHRLETATGMIPAVPAEGVFNEHPKVFRTALVGIGPRGSQLPLLCVEMEQGEIFTPEVEAELVQLAIGTRWEGIVRRFLVHPKFPVDPRHNSKIVREQLATWATARAKDLAPAQAAS
jgi:acyl-CoA synthetase (AMP-forming)/AMP-acid ligase II